MRVTARFETAGGVDLVRPDRSRRRSSRRLPFYLECDDLDERMELPCRSSVAFDAGPRNQPWMWREARLRDPDGDVIFFCKAGETGRASPWRNGRWQLPADMSAFRRLDGSTYRAQSATRCLGVPPSSSRLDFSATAGGCWTRPGCRAPRGPVLAGACVAGS